MLGAGEQVACACAESAAGSALEKRCARGKRCVPETGGVPVCDIEKNE